MKSIFKGSLRWRTIVVLAPLALLVVLAIATSGYMSASSAAYCSYGGVYGNCLTHLAPASQYGVSNDMLFVANGRESDVAVIDVGTMSIVDKIPVPNEVTPASLNAMNPGLMDWEIHGVVASKDRKSIYAVGALSGGSYTVPGDTTSAFRLADYEMYQVDVANKQLIREIPLQSAGEPINPVGYCGLEYNLNDENSNILVATSMNASNATLATVLHNADGTPVDLSGVRGSGPGVEVGGWAMENLTTGTNVGFMSTDFDGNLESSTCGIAWDASGTRGFASQMFQPLTDTVAWNAATATGTVDGSIAAPSGRSYHQEDSDKARGLLYVTSEDGNIDVIDMNTNAILTSINMQHLMGSTTTAAHSVDLSPANSNVIYVTARQTPDMTDNMEVALNVADINNPQVIGAVNGLATSVCGVYAISDKGNYYAAAHPTNNDMLFVANGRESDVAVADVASLSIVDKIPVPNEVTPASLNAMNPGLMDWEIHGVVASKDRTSIYAVGALSGGSYTVPGDTTSPFRLADYEMYQVNTATKTLEREIPLQSAGEPINPVGYCGLEYNLNDENSNILVATSMNASNATLATVLHNADGTPVDLSGVRGSGPGVEVGGWTMENLTTGTNVGFMSTDFDGNLESSTCGIAWDASGTRAWASQMFQPLTDTVAWNAATATGTVDGSIAAPSGRSYHQEDSDKARGLVYVTSEDGNIDVIDMSTNAIVTTINVKALAGSSTTAAHSVDLSPANSNIIYVTARQTPDMNSNMELIIDVTDINAPVLKGSIPGFAESVCGVYAISDKQDFYGTGVQPSLSLNRTRVYWGSYADYTNGLLSVDYSIGNDIAANAANVKIVGTSNTNGVTTATAMPVNVGSIATGGSASVTLQYNVGSATSFYTTTYATAQNGINLYSYPGPYPGP